MLINLYTIAYIQYPLHCYYVIAWAARDWKIAKLIIVVGLPIVYWLARSKTNASLLPTLPYKGTC